jgi:steroid delta-isomerase-like uncharacterized protein
MSQNKQPAKVTMKIYLLIPLCLLVCAGVGAEEKSADKEGDATNYKKDVAVWYEAFNTKNPALLDKILSAEWVDIPAAPGTPAGPAGIKPVFAQLTRSFPDLKLTVEEILQEGNKVVVRATMTGTHTEPFHGFKPKKRKRTMNIQVVDIHEFKNGKIVRTWHTEDWMSGFRQLGVFEKK